MTRQLNKTQLQHFLPHFCHGNFVLRSVITAELIAILLFLIVIPDWQYLGLTSLFIQWITLTSLVILCLIRPWLIKLTSLVSSIVILCITAGITLVSTLIASDFMATLTAQSTSTSSLIFMIYRNTTITLIMTGFLLRYTYIHYQMNQRQKLELQTKLQSLQSRIEPHFLFNSLNNIASLIPTQPVLAEKLIEDLSTLLRSSLNETTFTAPLTQEIRLAERYLNIEKMRIGERLVIQWEISSQVHDTLYVPYLFLQPLLENAIKHGIQPDPEGGYLLISIKQLNKKYLQIHIKNSLPKIKYTTKMNHHIGLDNTRERMSAIFGDTASMQTKKTDRYFYVTIKIPVKNNRSPLPGIDKIPAEHSSL